MIKRRKSELQEPHSITTVQKENQLINQNQDYGKIPERGEEYLFPYWDEYWDESDES
jgi:hypothetical protein